MVIQPPNLLDPRNQHLKKQRSICLEQPLKHPRPILVLLARQRQLVVLPRRENRRRRQFYPTHAPPAHAHHGLLQLRGELPAPHRPRHLVEFGVHLRREILHAAGFVRGREGFAPYRHLGPDLRSASDRRVAPALAVLAVRRPGGQDLECDVLRILGTGTVDGFYLTQSRCGSGGVAYIYRARVRSCRSQRTTNIM